MMRLAEKAFYPAKIPFPVLQVDTGYDFPEVLGRRDNWVNRLGVRLIVASVEEAIANGVVVDDGKTSRNRHPDRHPAQRPRGGRLHRRLRWRPPRRGEGPRQGARLLPPRRVRPVGPEDAAPRAVEPLQRPDPRGRAHADLPDLATGPSSTSGTTSAARASRSPPSTSPTSAGSSSATGCCCPRATLNPTREGETVEERTVRFRTVGDLTLTGCVESDGRHHRRDHRRDRHRPRHRARRDPWRRPVLRGRHGGPEEGGLLLMATHDDITQTQMPSRPRHGPAPLRHRRLRRRRQVDPHRPAAARLQVDLRGPARGRRGDLAVQGLRLHRPRAAHRRPALRARAGHHHRRGLPLLRDADPQVHHRRHPRPRSVHAQHGHRRLDRRPRPGARRRPPGPHRAVPPARGDPLAAAGPAPGARGQQDGPRRLLPGDLREDPRRVHRRSRPSSTSPTSRSSRSRRSRATTSSTAPRTWRGTPVPR